MSEETDLLREKYRTQCSGCINRIDKRLAEIKADRVGRGLDLLPPVDSAGEVGLSDG